MAFTSHGIRVCFLCLGVAALPASAIAAENEPPCKAELLMEAASGEVLFEQGAQEPLPPASMIKLMVAYVVFKRAAEGSLSLNDPVTVSARSSKIGGSQVYLKEGEQFTVQALLEAVLIQSGNDAAAALAEHIGGSPEGFVEIMRAEAQGLGLKGSEFHSPHGLPPGKGQSPDLVSAADFAKLAQALIRDYPQVLQYTALTEKGFRNDAFMMRNHNHLLRSYPGCDGLKTGYYHKAGFCVTATAQRNGLRLVAVLMGCAGRRQRDDEAARLFSMGFAKYRTVKLIEQGQPAGQSVKILNGAQPEIAPVAVRTVNGMVRIGAEPQVEKRFSLCPPIGAPVAADTPCGSVSFLAGGREIGKTDLIIPAQVPALSLGGRLLRVIGF